jgi:REP element-mobilizing transposase RayT
MPRKIRIEFPGALYHVTSRNQRRKIFSKEEDRGDFLETVGDACRKAGFRVHAYCLMADHFHLVVETPQGNLVAGMRWLMSSYSVRLKHRRQTAGNVFSGRYKALLVESRDNAYLKSVCDYVHLQPAEQKVIGPRDELAAYPWSSLWAYLAPPKERPEWLSTKRLLEAHGIAQDTAAGRRAFEKAMENRRLGDNHGEWTDIRRGWCFGSDKFKDRMLEQEKKLLTAIRSGKTSNGIAETKANAIIKEELLRRGWTAADLKRRLKGDPEKLEIALRLRNETTLSIPKIAELLNLGTWKSAVALLHIWSTRMSEE